MSGEYDFGSRNLLEFRHVENMLSSHEFNKSLIQGISELTKSPLSLDNYAYAGYFILKKFSKNKSDLNILDMGCFVGLFVDFLKKQGYTNSFGIDNSKKFIAAGRKLKINNLSFADAKSASQHFKTNFFDLIFCIQMIHNDESRPIREVHDITLSVCREAHVLLKNRGVFFLNTYVPLPIEKILLIGFKQVNPSFSSRTKNYIFRKVA